MLRGRDGFPFLARSRAFCATESCVARRHSTVTAQLRTEGTTMTFSCLAKFIL